MNNILFLQYLLHFLHQLHLTQPTTDPLTNGKGRSNSTVDSPVVNSQDVNTPNGDDKPKSSVKPNGEEKPKLSSSGSRQTGTSKSFLANTFGPLLFKSAYQSILDVSFLHLTKWRNSTQDSSFKVELTSLLIQHYPYIFEVCVENSFTTR